MYNRKNNIKSLLPVLGAGDKVKLLLSAVFISAVFIPLIRMFAHMDVESIRKVSHSPVFGEALRNSLTVAVLGTLITLVLAFVLAFVTQRINIKGRYIWIAVFSLPMLIPSISIGMGLVILLGNNGILTNLFGLSGNIYGLQGIIAGSLLYAFPVAYLMIADVLNYEDGSAYEAALVLGIPKWRQFLTISLPYLKKPIISTAFSVFSLIVTDYGVPLMVGGKFKTIATVMYQEVIGQLDFGKGAVYGSFLLMPAIAAFLIDFINKDKGNTSFVTRKVAMSDSSSAKCISYLICGMVSVITLLPIISFVLLAFASDYPRSFAFTLSNVSKTFALKAGRYLANSILIAACTASIGVCIGFVTAYLSARMKSTVSRFLHLAAMTSAAIPGVVLGLSYVLTFTGTPIYGTIVIMIMVNTIHFITSPYLMMYNSLSKINENLEGVAHTMGIGRRFLIRDVFLPQCRTTLFEMFSYFFVNCMMTISAVSFLATTANKPVSLMINQFEAQMQLEYAAVVALMILLVNLTVKLVCQLVSRRRKGLLQL